MAGRLRKHAQQQTGWSPGGAPVPLTEYFLAARLHAELVEGAPGLEFHPAIAPEPDDTVLTKHRVSAFAGSGLDVLLRSLGTTHLVLTGVSTSTVVHDPEP